MREALNRPAFTWSPRTALAYLRHRFCLSTPISKPDTLRLSLLPLSRVMNTKSLIISIIVVFLALTITDILIHGVWLSPLYAATKDWTVSVRKRFLHKVRFLTGLELKPVSQIYVTRRVRSTSRSWQSQRSRQVFLWCKAFCANGATHSVQMGRDSKS